MLETKNRDNPLRAIRSAHRRAVTVKKETTTTTEDSGGGAAVLSGTLNVIGTVILLPVRVVGVLIGAIL